MKRPEILYPLFAPIESLKGVGTKLKPSLKKLVGDTVWDLLSHLPRASLTRIKLDDIEQARLHHGKEIIVIAKSFYHQVPPKMARGSAHNRPYRVVMHDKNPEIRAVMDLVFFKARSDYLQNILPVDSLKIIIGKCELYQGKVQIIHPQILDVTDENLQKFQTQPIYPLTFGISQMVLIKLIGQALSKLPKLPEWLPDNLRKQHDFPDLKTAFAELHQPKDPESLLPQNRYWQRLAFDELFANQLMLGMINHYATHRQMRAPRPAADIDAADQLIANIIKSLPYQLTESQNQSLDEIITALQGKQKMLRLLQGDVGTGKTILALLAMVWASTDSSDGGGGDFHLRGINAGQAALMAPTDILARQHFDNFQKILAPFDIDIILLTGKMKTAEKRAATESIASGKSQIIIGTHSLFQEQTHYHNLRLAVIDEQHRFGVHQRLIFSHKAANLDMLVMSATPIPRTLMLSYWNNLEISRLTDRPHGARIIETRILSDSRMGEIIQAVARALKQNRKIYWVCPFIEESDVMKIIDVTARSEMLREIFDEKQIITLHGKMSSPQKHDAIDRFSHGGAAILVATSIIEVGVDVPDASIMIIEHAEQFGLAALHQLRGRVGRGTLDSYCLLIHSNRLSAFARERLQTIRKSNDGFEIAELDLKLRGGGDIFGIRQSGLPAFRFVDWGHHQHLTAVAHALVREIIDSEAYRDSKTREALEILLILYGHDNALALLQSG